ncbi:hypothetical protein LZ30DRAFT_787573 [Colletotrichum cereale]|nr:hypothetical protein LZ30DRAFT_787573 [Colletotrichum cereale]
MRASAVLFILFAALTAAAPSQLGEASLGSLLDTRQCAGAGVCSAKDANGQACADLKCCNGKAGSGGNKIDGFSCCCI